jgi:hypothetical protein
VKHAGVLAPASPCRSRFAPQSPEAAEAGNTPVKPAHAGAWRPWAELLARTFAVDVPACPRCQGRMKLLGLVKNPAIISRTLATVGEATEVPQRSPGRGPPFFGLPFRVMLSAGFDLLRRKPSAHENSFTEYTRSRYGDTLYL